MKATIDVVIVGSGPYGLSISAHLTERRVEHRIFGPPMQFWKDMPVGIFLKSLDFATNVYAPRGGHSFVEYCRSRGLSSEEPVPMSRFAEYGLWAQERLASHLEQAMVTRVERSNGSFELELANGERVRARKVVVATGLSGLARMPGSLQKLPAELVSHTAEHRRYDGFPGKDVAVLGRGSSALEAAALLLESGARPKLLTHHGAGWLFAGPPVHPRPLRHQIMYPRSVLGPGRLNFFLDHVPFGLHYLPDDLRVRLTRKHLGPWGPWWLADRFEGKVPVAAHRRIVRATPAGEKLTLRLVDVRNGEQEDLTVDHLIAGTGYEPELERLSFLAPSLVQSIERLERAPRLSADFESSVPGLYFVGPISAYSFGPLVRFVAGAQFCSKRVARHAAKKPGSVLWSVPQKVAIF